MRTIQLIFYLILHISTFDFLGKSLNITILHQNFRLNRLDIGKSELYDYIAFCIHNNLLLIFLTCALFLNYLLISLFLHFQMILDLNCDDRTLLEIALKNLPFLQLLPLIFTHHCHLHFPLFLKFLQL